MKSLHRIRPLLGIQWNNGFLYIQKKGLKQNRGFSRHRSSDQPPKGLPDCNAPWGGSGPPANWCRNFILENPRTELAEESWPVPKTYTEIQNQSVPTNEIYNCQIDKIFRWHCQSHSQFVGYTDWLESRASEWEKCADWAADNSIRP